MAAQFKATKTQTRRRTIHFALGHPSELPVNMLPLEADIYNKFKKMKEENVNAPKKEVAKAIAEEVVAFWQDKGNLPTLAVYSVQLKVIDVYERGRNVLKIPRDRREKLLDEMDREEAGAGDENKIGRKKKKMDTLDKLFDISSCFHQSRSSCNCPAAKKVAEREFPFLNDQRTERMMSIATKDDKVTKAWDKLRDKKEKNAKYEEKEATRQIEVRQTAASRKKEFLEDQKDAQSYNDNDFIHLPKKAGTNQNRLTISRFSTELDRYNVSDGAGVALATALLEDLGMISDEKKDLVFDRFKIRRARQRHRTMKKKEKQASMEGKLFCIGTDGKRDKKTKVIIEKEVNNNVIESRAEVTEEHIVYTDPFNYISHSVIDEGCGDGHNLGKDLVDVVREFKSEDTLECIVCDGTSVMTGCYNGVLANVERELGRELQWSICQLHANECPMRHVFQELDGGYGTSGPTSFHGPMGKAITEPDKHLQPVVKFVPVTSPDLPELPDSVVHDLSRDQYLMYRYCVAVHNGEVPADLASQKPGGINHASWLTFAENALIDYTRDPKPSAAKRKFISYIQKVYVPAWFIIKTKPHIRHGARNTFTIMQLIKKQPSKVQEVAKKSFQHNSFFAHSSNLFLTMLTDDRENVRQKAVNAIVDMRHGEVVSKIEKTSSGLRVFRVPELRWDAKDYTEMIGWDLELFTEPAVTRKLSDNALREAYAAPLEIPKFPNNSQSVERAVKLVSEACHQVFGQERRHELCVSRQAARLERAAYNTKKDFKRNV